MSVSGQTEAAFRFLSSVPVISDGLSIRHRCLLGFPQVTELSLCRAWPSSSSCSQPRGAEDGGQRWGTVVSAGGRWSVLLNCCLL